MIPFHKLQKHIDYQALDKIVLDQLTREEERIDREHSEARELERLEEVAQEYDDIREMVREAGIPESCFTEAVHAQLEERLKEELMPKPLPKKEDVERNTDAIGSILVLTTVLAGWYGGLSFVNKYFLSTPWEVNTITEGVAVVGTLIGSGIASLLGSALLTVSICGEGYTDEEAQRVSRERYQRKENANTVLEKRGKYEVLTYYQTFGETIDYNEAVKSALKNLPPNWLGEKREQLQIELLQKENEVIYETCKEELLQEGYAPEFVNQILVPSLQDESPKEYQKRLLAEVERRELEEAKRYENALEWKIRFRPR